MRQHVLCWLGFHTGPSLVPCHHVRLCLSCGVVESTITRSCIECNTNLANAYLLAWREDMFIRAVDQVRKLKK